MIITAFITMQFKPISHLVRKYKNKHRGEDYYLSKLQTWINSNEKKTKPLV